MINKQDSDSQTHPVLRCAYLAAPIAVLFFTPLTSCDRKSQTATVQDATGKSHIEATPFMGEAYRTADNSESITLISPDELEFRTKGTTLLCKYSKQQDALRVVMTAFGTQQVVYFRAIPAGYQAEDNRVFLSPASFRNYQEQQRLASEAQMRARQAEQDRLARAKAIEKESRNRTAELFSLSEDVAKDLTVGDTDIRWKSYPQGLKKGYDGKEIKWSDEGKEPEGPYIMWFGAITALGVKNPERRSSWWGIQLEFVDRTPVDGSGNAQPSTILFGSKQSRDSVLAQLDKAIQAWTAKFPSVRTKPYRRLDIGER